MNEIDLAPIVEQHVGMTRTYHPVPWREGKPHAFVVVERWHESPNDDSVKLVVDDLEVTVGRRADETRFVFIDTPGVPDTPTGPRLYVALNDGDLYLNAGEEVTQ